MGFPEYTTKNIKEVFNILNTDESGLLNKEAEKRLKDHGFNEIKTKETGLLEIFLRQLKSPFSYLLIAAALIAFLIGEKIDGLMILLFVFINVSLGFFQEARAHKAISLLRKYLNSKARILRKGIEKVIDKRFLVPGDVVLLEQGDIVPADLRVLRFENFLVDESILSGESAPMPKLSRALFKEAEEVFEAKNIVFAGTSIVSGEAEGVVINTGKKTVFGEIAKLVSGISRESVYEKDLLKFSNLILKVVTTTIVLVFLANLIIKGTANFFDFLLFCIALIVSIIPEALPLIVTIALSNGALKLAKEKVVVKRLSAVEDLGDIEILCTDKTGTLTENKLKLEEINSSDEQKCLLYGLLSSSYMKEKIESSLNSFDSAIFKKTPKKIRSALKKIKVISEISFNPSRLRSSVLVEDKNKNLILIVKGAPEVILKLCSMAESDFEKISEEIKKQGREGKRTLAVGFKKFSKRNFSKKDEKDLDFLGYFCFSDPLKKTAEDAVRLSKKLGVKVKIITGDGKEIAEQVAREVALVKGPGEVILGENLKSLSQEDFEKACEKYSVFARISPEMKYKIIEALTKKYEVGFLGEGVNDAPALKIAHLGIAVESAADVSREVSDIVLFKKDLKVIVEGIKTGRNIFSNINKYIKCTLASNFGNFYSIAAIAVIIPFLPMLPVQILLVNLLSDFPLISVASDKVDPAELKRPKLYHLNKMILLIFLLALVSLIFDFIFFGIFYKVEPDLLRTLWFIESILTEIALIFSIRTSLFFLRAKRPSLLLIFISFLAFLITIFLPFTDFGKETFHFVPPSPAGLLTVLALVLSYFIISEIVKLSYFHYRKLK
ncbi:MAG: HAD-IC family P-type ATPase [bacterium]|nr:HAD-IC family P-type ATPase [bacterium]